MSLAIILELTYHDLVDRLGKQCRPRARSLHMQSLYSLSISPRLQRSQWPNEDHYLRGIGCYHGVLLGKFDRLPCSCTTHREVVGLGRCHSRTIPGDGEY